MSAYNAVRGDVNSYDLLHPNKKQGHYRFDFRDDAPEAIKKDCRSFIISDDAFTDQDEPLAAAYEIEEYAEKCIYNRDKETIKLLISYLEKMQDFDERDRLLAKAERMRKDLAALEIKLEKAIARCQP